MRLVRPGSLVHDLGAQVGAYTLLASRLVGPKGRVIAFEPLARNVEFLRKHVELNGCANIEMLEAAAPDADKIRAFEVRHSSTSAITPDGNLHVASFPIVFPATRGPEIHALCLGLLEDHTYKVGPQAGLRDVSEPDELISWHPTLPG